MKFLTAAHTDVGVRKKTNQDSLLIHQAHTSRGDVLFAAVCDGMGGLAKGEVASARLTRELSAWFIRDFPAILYGGGSLSDALHQSWKGLIDRESRAIRAYGENVGVELGTTCVCFLAVEDKYYIMNVGDSRAYQIDGGLYQLTKDQTWVQREVDLGRISYQQSLNHPQRNILLQSVGAGALPVPDFYSGEIKAGQSYLLCCDGFRHVIEPREFQEAFEPRGLKNKEVMRRKLEQLTELNKQRGETDNISAVLIRVSR